MTKTIEDGGTAEYADALATYLAMTVSKQADLDNDLCRWEPNAECPRQLFARQAIPMVWDFAEGNPLGDSSGSWQVLLDGSQRASPESRSAPDAHLRARSSRPTQRTRSFANVVISTDPPYYDNIGYSDLSDFFYVWLRRSLRDIYPELLSTMLVPKAEELVANPHRHDGKAGAKEFFEDGFREVFAHARSAADGDYPITVYYAFKQSRDRRCGRCLDWLGDAAGRNDSFGLGDHVYLADCARRRASRMIAQDTNALASSIVLSLRPRDRGRC